MGFMDKLKSTAKIVAEQAEKAVEKNFAPQIEGKELTERQKELFSYGHITNPDVELEEGKYFSLTIDDEERKLLIIYNASAKLVFNHVEKISAEYSFDDVIELKCISVENKSTSYVCKYKLILSSGKAIDFTTHWRYLTPEEFQSTEWVSVNSYRLTDNLDGFAKPIELQLMFGTKVFDAETKSNINYLYEDRGYLPLYDEKGNFISESIQKNWDIFHNFYPLNNN